mgnify:CR=1 FL=1
MRRPMVWVAGIAIIVGVAGAAWLADNRQVEMLLPFLRRDATWQAIQQRGVWRVGLDPSFPPFEMLDAEGTPIGFDVALAQALAESWGVRVEIELPPASARIIGRHLVPPRSLRSRAARFAAVV